MKRTSFIASAASALFINPPLLAKAEAFAQQAPLKANMETPGWRNPSWFCASAVVWLDTASGFYHYKGDRRYGCTPNGAYTCENEAIASGHRAGVEA